MNISLKMQIPSERRVKAFSKEHLVDLSGERVNVEGVRNSMSSNGLSESECVVDSPDILRSVGIHVISASWCVGCI